MYSTISLRVELGFSVLECKTSIQISNVSHLGCQIYDEHELDLENLYLNEYIFISTIKY